jgi:hypothetical protein
MSSTAGSEGSSFDGSEPSSAGGPEAAGDSALARQQSACRGERGCSNDRRVRGSAAGGVSSIGIVVGATQSGCEAADVNSTRLSSLVAAPSGREGTRAADDVELSESSEEGEYESGG